MDTRNHTVIDILQSTPDILATIREGTESVHIKMSKVIRRRKDSDGKVFPKYDEDIHRFEMAEKWRDTSLEPLADIDSLHTLNIEDIGVADFSPIGRMTSLKNLRLRDLRAESLDISPLGLCDQLQTIEISGKMRRELLGSERRFLEYVDLRPLGKCEILRSIRVGYSNIPFFSLPSNPNLEILDLSHNHIVTKLMVILGGDPYRKMEESNTLDLSQLEGCDNLSKLNLEWNLIWAIDLSPLSLLDISPEKPLHVHLANNGEMADEGAVCVDGVWGDPRFKIWFDHHVRDSDRLRVVDSKGDLLRWGL